MTEDANTTESHYGKAQKTETWSGIHLEEIYTPEDVRGIEYKRDLADAGEYPFTRGIHRNMYRGKYPTRRMISGFGSATDTNQRLKYYLKTGFSGLDVYPDIAGMLNIDADHPRCKGEVGVQGVSISSLQDFEDLADGLPLDKINGLWRGYVTIPFIVIMAERQNIDIAKLRGTILNVHPLVVHYAGELSPEGLDLVPLHLKLIVDIVEYCTKYMPNFYCTYFDGYNLREYGLTAPQELAWVFTQAIDFIDRILKRGLKMDEFGPRMTFFLSSHIGFFEEIAKFRAARRMWARIMREKYGAKDPRAQQMKFAVETAGSTVVAPQPRNNIVRIAYEAMAATLGGVQSMSLPSYLEAISLPTEESARIAVNTQLILNYETGVCDVSDPLGGSYYVEYLTSKIEEETNEIIKEIMSMDGIVEAAKAGWVDKIINEAVVKRQKEIENKDRVIVGLNEFVAEEEEEVPVNYFENPAHEHVANRGNEITDKLKKLKATRDNTKVIESLRKLRAKAEEGEHVNLVSFAIEAAKAYATIGEIIGIIREAYGYKYDPFDEIESPLKD